MEILTVLLKLLVVFDRHLGELTTCSPASRDDCGLQSLMELTIFYASCGLTFSAEVLPENLVPQAPKMNLDGETNRDEHFRGQREL